jgi:hypothetical protein
MLRKMTVNVLGNLLGAGIGIDDDTMHGGLN